MRGWLQAVAVKATRRTAPRIPRLSRLREHRWSPPERVVVILVVAIVMGSLFVTAYSLALGDPIPHRIQVALVGLGGVRPRPPQPPRPSDRRSRHRAARGFTLEPPRYGYNAIEISYVDVR